MHAARVSTSDNIDSLSALGKMNNAGFPDSEIGLFLFADKSCVDKKLNE